MDPHARGLVPNPRDLPVLRHDGCVRDQARPALSVWRRLQPDMDEFIALAPLLFFNYVGFELPNSAGDEMKDAQKDVPVTVLRACITAILLYGLPCLRSSR